MTVGDSELRISVLTALLVMLPLGPVRGDGKPQPTLKSSTLRIVHLGQKETITLYGENIAPTATVGSKPPLQARLLGIKPTEGDAKARGAQQVSVEVAMPPNGPPGTYDVTLKNPDGTSVSVPVAALAVPAFQAATAKQPAAGFAQAMPLPGPFAAVTGAVTRDSFDVFSFATKSGETWEITLLAGRVGSELDALLRLRTASHLSLALSAGAPAKDRAIRFRVPADGTYYLEVSDADGRGGPTFGYHLIVKRVD
jgi:hypothetical protein